MNDSLRELKNVEHFDAREFWKKVIFALVKVYFKDIN